MNGNKLTSLPSQIGELINLKSLYLDDNQLTSLPVEIGQLKSLQYLSLYQNPMTKLPNEIGALENLQYLELESSQLMSVPPEYLKKLKNLIKVTLRDKEDLNPLKKADLELLRQVMPWCIFRNV